MEESGIEFTAERLEKFKALTSNQVAALLSRPDYKEIADRIRAEATEGVDTDELLSMF
jgi:hypothetical protein